VCVYASEGCGEIRKGKSLTDLGKRERVGETIE
jgi:hypothetical protein